ncbi:MAG: glycosyltransferase 87 family protein [Candidatus Methylarchaceae archaeon HK02M2]|nr:glycosyltransferase 87 family protein [Candidatus Methylarchaceae archaeon HK02M2]
MILKKLRITPIRLLFIFYTVILAIIYLMAVPLELGYEWYNFYDYLNTNDVIPYIEYREGYPPIGFLPYFAVYFITGQNDLFFTYGFRALNLVLLISTLYLLFLIIKSLKGERKALQTSLIFALLPSIALTNAYSNDVIALFFSAFAIYYLIQRRPGLTGLMIGLGVMSKGFPLLLLIPSIFYFDKWKERYKLIRATAILILAISLPFLIFDFFTYYSTFIHHGTRGPWETVWALIEGWYSHGGFLHPAFDQFFYHTDLLNMYDLSPYDHVFYLWNYPWLPPLLTIAPFALILFGVLIFKGKKQYILQFVGFTYFSYMFFFKGYSTQFSVTSPFYVLIALGSYMVPLILVLESSQMLQWLTWNAGWSDQHYVLLVSAILIRTIFFIVILYQTSHHAYSLRHKISLKINYKWAKINIASTLKKAWKPSILVILSVVILIGLVISVQSSIKFNETEKNVELSLNRPEYISLGKLAKDDRVMLKLETRSEVIVQVVSQPESRILEKGNINPPSFRGYFDDTRYFFVTDYPSSYTLKLLMVYPSIPFRITDGLYGDADVNISAIEGNVSMLNITVEDRGVDKQNTLFRLAYPVDEIVDENFEVKLNLRLDKGNLSKILFDVFDITDDWLYTFNISSNVEKGSNWICFKLDKDSRDISGSTNILGDRISQLAISMLIEDGNGATVTIGNFEIQSNKGNVQVPLYAENNEEIDYAIYWSSKYHLEIQHFVIWFGFILCLIALDRELRILR